MGYILLITFPFLLCVFFTFWICLASYLLRAYELPVARDRRVGDPCSIVSKSEVLKVNFNPFTEGLLLGSIQLQGPIRRLAEANS